MYAIIEDSGTQIKVMPGDIVEVDLRDLGTTDDEKATITFDRVLMVGNTDSDDAATIGTPYLGGATVTGEVLGEMKGEKIDVIKYKRRKGYKRKKGHRQRFLRVKITDISS